MRNSHDDIIDNMRERFLGKIKNTINQEIEYSVGNTMRTSKDNRAGLHNWGALQMSNYLSNDYATFGVGFGSRRVGV